MTLPPEKLTDAYELLAELGARTPPVPVIALTGTGAFDDRVEVARRGGRAFLPKSLSPAELLGTAKQLLSPVIQALGIVGLALALSLGAVNWQFAVAFLLVAYGYGLLLSGVALLLDELTPGRGQGLPDQLLMLGWALLEPLGYRQLTVVWRLRGIVRYLRKQSDWGAMTRTGFTPQPASSVSRTAHVETTLTNRR